MTSTVSLLWKTAAAVVRGIGHDIAAVARTAEEAIGLASAEAGSG